MRRMRLLALALALAVLVSGCVFMAAVPEEPLDVGPELEAADPKPVLPEDPGDSETPPESQEPEAPDEPSPDGSNDTDHSWAPDYGGYYYDVANVVLYLEAYGELPGNYITKDQAKELGWSGGSVEDYLEGAAIGGDRFGNYEGLLPEDAQYTECDIDTDGFGSRGSRRLVFSDDGRYYYTSDHYESFSQVTVTEDHRVQW